MDELTSPSSEEKSTGVFIHDLSVRFNEQVIPLEALEPTEVLAESKLQLAGSISGAVNNDFIIRYSQSYRPFLEYKKVEIEDNLNSGKFRFDFS